MSVLIGSDIMSLLGRPMQSLKQGYLKFLLSFIVDCVDHGAIQVGTAVCIARGIDSLVSTVGLRPLVKKGNGLLIAHTLSHLDKA